MTKSRGFLLDCFSGKHRGKPAVFVMGRLETGETFGLVDDQRRPTLYVRRSDRDKISQVASPSTFSTMDAEAVCAVECADIDELWRTNLQLRQQGVRTYEGDIDFATGYLMAHHLRGSIELSGPWTKSDHVGRVYINPQVSPCDWEPTLRVMALDIETDVVRDQVLAVSLVCYGLGDASEEVLVVEEAGAAPADAPSWYQACPSEAALLATLQQRLKALDPDVVTGWNLIEFDLPMLARRYAQHRLPWDLGRTRQRPGAAQKGRSQSMPGRQVLDAMRLVRASQLRLDDMKLATVAQALLGRGKTIEASQDEDQATKITQAYRRDRVSFASYCLEDSRLVRDILVKEKLIELTVSRTRLIGLPLAKTAGSVAGFEFVYLSELHRRNKVAPSHGVDRPTMHDVPGGLVLASQSGLYEHILIFDFRSLYPSIIRTFNIDPLAHAQATLAPADVLVAPNGAKFVRQRGILPEMLDRFFASRAAAQEVGNTVAAYAYKIMMNSFYGVLGTDSCRFAAPGLAGGITSFGHQILRWTKAAFERHGFTVLYGDTDSLFIDIRFAAAVTPLTAVAEGTALAAQITGELAAHLLATYDVESRLELKFEKYYRWLLLPKSRGGTSRAKSYAGLKQTAKSSEVEITGMEAVRSDWTPLARDLQRELLGMLFSGSPPDALAARLGVVVDALRRGELDQKVVYRKRIRRALADYTSTTPPHIKAAHLLTKAPSVIRYLMTVAGPQPLGRITAKIDYDHYVEKQVIPIAAALGELVGFDAAAACRLPKTGQGLFND